MIQAFAGLALAVASVAAQSATIDLQPIVACVSAGPLKAVEAQKRTSTDATRAVSVAGGLERQVSVLEGYRVMLASASGQYFVNLKIERSAADKAEADRDAIRQQMQAFVAKAPAGSPPMKHENSGGVETVGMDQSSLEVSGTMGLYTLFVPKADLVVTAYLLNQPPAKRDFATYADYERLRDQALEQVKACLPKAAS